MLWSQCLLFDHKGTLKQSFRVLIVPELMSIECEPIEVKADLKVRRTQGLLMDCKRAAIKRGCVPVQSRGAHNIGQVSKGVCCLFGVWTGCLLLYAKSTTCHLIRPGILTLIRAEPCQPAQDFGLHYMRAGSLRDGKSPLI